MYDRKHLIWSPLLMFLMHMESRFQFSLERHCETLAANVARLAGLPPGGMAHADTWGKWLRRIPWRWFSQLRQSMVLRLIRMKALDGFRLHGRFLIAVDATGVLAFHHRHCPRCLTQKLSNGQTLFFHPVLEAKLVTSNGLALSVASVFIENPETGTYEKQACEKKAFGPMAAELKATIPRLPICLLLDALYADRNILDICRSNRWNYFITFKRGSMPSVWDDAQGLLRLNPGNRLATTDPDGLRSLYQWVPDVPVGTHRVQALFCRETVPDGTSTLFAWLTNFPIDRSNVIGLTHGGGRLRWKIEDEGFKDQKTGGFALEHAYSQNENAVHVFYLLLQVAHLLQQLMTHGSLLKPFKALFATLRNYGRRLTESLRHEYIPPPDQWPPTGQIRWDTT